MSDPIAEPPLHHKPNTRVFIDTNVVVYLYSRDETEKSERALQCLQQTDTWISTQVLNELSTVLRRKFKLAHSDILNVIDELEATVQIATVTTTVIRQALVLGHRYGYSHYDCLMLACALEQSCSTLYSEDMQHGQIIEPGLRIINPF